MKTLDTNSYLNFLCELTEENKTVFTIVKGYSMSPFLIDNRDFVYLEKPSRELKKGDIVLYKRKNSSFVLHRIRYIKNNNYYLIGDSQNITEGGIKREQIFAVAVKVKRNGKLLTPKNFKWKFYSTIWLYCVPLRPLIFKINRLIKR